LVKNKNLFIIPCHRVVRSDSFVGQYVLGADKKVNILVKEGVEIETRKVKNIEKYLHKFPLSAAH